MQKKLRSRLGYFTLLALTLALISNCSQVYTAKGLIEERGLKFTKDEFIQLADTGQLDLVRLYVEAGMDVNTRAQKKTALLVSVEKNRKDVAAYLISRNAQLELKNELGQSPLIIAAANGNESLVKLLLDNQAQIDSQDLRQATPLSWAAAKGHTAVVNQLILAGAKLEPSYLAQVNPLISAALAESKGTVEYLLDQRGLDLNQHLLLAADQGLTSLVENLLHRGAFVNTENAEGKTALLCAVTKGYLETAKVLLDYGADPQMSYRTGTNAFSLAQQQGQVAMLDLLGKYPQKQKLREKIAHN